MLKNILCLEEKEFHEWLLRVGDGREETYPEIGEDMIKIPKKLKPKSKTQGNFAKKYFLGYQRLLKLHSKIIKRNLQY